jgi:IPT/TIG domain
MAGASFLARRSNRETLASHTESSEETAHAVRGLRWLLAVIGFAALVTLPSHLILAQGSPSIKSVDPPSCKVNDSISVAGENLGKSMVSAVYLSDEKTDYKAVIVQQESAKIVVKVPQVKPGDYNVSIQTGAAIYIQPVRITVER